MADLKRCFSRRLYCCHFPNCKDKIVALWVRSSITSFCLSWISFSISHSGRTQVGFEMPGPQKDFLIKLQRPIIGGDPVNFPCGTSCWLPEAPVSWREQHVQVEVQGAPGPSTRCLSQHPHPGHTPWFVSAHHTRSLPPTTPPLPAPKPGPHVQWEPPIPRQATSCFWT